LPTLWVQPAAVANSSDRNHAAMRLSQATRMTEAPSPTSRRPMTATLNSGASPNSAVPNAMVTPPTASVHRGPTPSARLPATSAMAVKT